MKIFEWMRFGIAAIFGPILRLIARLLAFSGKATKIVAKTMKNGASSVARNVFVGLKELFIRLTCVDIFGLYYIATYKVPASTAMGCYDPYMCGYCEDTPFEFVNYKPIAHASGQRPRYIGMSSVNKMVGLKADNVPERVVAIWMIKGPEFAHIGFGYAITGGFITARHVVAGPRSVETARMNGYEICVSQTSLVVRALTGHSFVKVDLDRTSVYTPLVTEEKHDMTRDFAFVKAKDLNAKLGIRTPSLQFLTEYTMHASYHYRWNGDKYVFYRAAGGSRRSPPNGRWPPRSSSCRLTATPSAATRRTCRTSSLTPGTRSRRHPPGYPPPKTGARPRP